MTAIHVLDFDEDGNVIGADDYALVNPKIISHTDLERDLVDIDFMSRRAKMKFKVMKRILEDGTPVENVVAMHNTAHKCGVYK